MARELGFNGILYNSMNAVADRDFVLEALQWGSFLSDPASSQMIGLVSDGYIG